MSDTDTLLCETHSDRVVITLNRPEKRNALNNDLRGGIIDVFPATAELPLRLEFVGNELESLRRFDAVSQRSIEQLQASSFEPATEARLDDAARGLIGSPQNEILTLAAVGSDALSQVSG